MFKAGKYHIKFRVACHTILQSLSSYSNIRQYVLTVVKAGKYHIKFRVACHTILIMIAKWYGMDTHSGQGREVSH